MQKKEFHMTKHIDTGYFDPAQSALNGGFADLASLALEGNGEIAGMDDDLFEDYDEDKDLQDVISLGLHMAD